MPTTDLRYATYLAGKFGGLEYERGKGVAVFQGLECYGDCSGVLDWQVRKSGFKGVGLEG